ncbi:tyrosine--tRNA ligase [Candidatus Peregrinibacteria bacterium]|nr:tyrosine--tRNA ligase [Candidatus Peregrinibacteria bacterium]
MNIQTLLDRGTVDVIVREELEEKLKSGNKLNIKLGIDPSGADLHIGHMVVIKKLQEFLETGHNIQLIFGNFTGQIGDPTDKLNARPPKKQEELEKNAKKYLNQAGKILDTKNVQIFWNADWLEKLNFTDVVRLSQVFTVHQMLERDMYQERIKKNHPIFIHEFLYPLMQGYDSVELKSDLEIGGTDQTFNLLAGRTIQKAYGQKPQCVLTVPLLIGTDGKDKMGKSLDNYIGVDESPQEMFGKTMSIPDKLIVPYFELATNISLEEIDNIKKVLDEGQNPRDLKIRLAKEIVTLYHDKEAAKNAEKEFINIFSKKEIPEDIETKKMEKTKWNIVDLITEAGLTSSKSEARRIIEGGGVRVDEEKINSIEKEIDISEKRLLKVGKRKFLKVTGK